ncbi:MAG: glycosyltransferase [Pseudomonadota bacterium]
MSAPRLTVILCTHNPRVDYFARTLAALRAQTLPASAWEFLVVDNASQPPLVPASLSAAHPGARVVVEPALGLTHARLRGIAEARADILAWVDDDNLLEAGYLAQALALADENPGLGVWGCGNFTPEWETPPPPEFTPYLAYLAVGSRTEDCVSSAPFAYDALPAGAGLCVRAAVARHYAAKVRADPRRLALGRTGEGLGACEDFDLGQSAIALGLSTGVFTRLALTHLMPAGRVREDYLQRLVEGHARSSVLLHHLYGHGRLPSQGLIAGLRRWRYRQSLSPVDRRIDLARQRGERAALRELAAAQTSS